MQQTEKTQTTTGLPPAAENVCNRYYLEHTHLYEHLQEELKQYDLTGTELNGIACRMVRFDDQTGIYNALSYLRHSIDVLLKKMVEQKNSQHEDSLLHATINSQLDLLELFHWLDAYGPRPTVSR